MKLRDAALRYWDPWSVDGIEDLLGLAREHTDDCLAIAVGVVDRRYTAIIVAPDYRVVLAQGAVMVGAPRLEVLPRPGRVWCDRYGSEWRLQLIYPRRVVDMVSVHRPEAQWVESVLSA